MDDRQHEAPEATGMSRSRMAPRLVRINVIIVVVGIALSFVGVFSLVSLMSARTVTAQARDQYEECTSAANELMAASDYLTAQARMGVVMGNVVHMKNYLNEYDNERHRDHAVEVLVRNCNGTLAQKELSEALQYSNELTERELYAMKIACEAFDVQDVPPLIAEVQLTEEDEKLTNYEKSVLAEGLVLGDQYDKIKMQIKEDVTDCSKALADDLWNNRMRALGKEQRLHGILFAALVMDVLLLVVAGISNYFLVMRPLRNHVLSIQQNKPLEVKGSREVRNVALSYNRLYKDNIRRTMMLKKQAQTDALTGLYNRGTFDHLLETRDDDISLLIADVDLFKDINDENGHEVGDKVLIRVAELLKKSFRTTDYACRIGGDEFAVVLMGMGDDARTAVARKIEAVSAELASASDELPRVTLSIGIAFGSQLPEGTNLYHAADTALYEAKHRGRNRYVFYDGGLT